MARLQILELPSGSGDDRPPFVLVIDEAATGPDGELLIKAADYIEAREHIGACDVFVFEETVEIPANEPPPLTEVVDDPERAGTTQLVHAHERSRLALCDALLLSRDTTWHQITEQVGKRQQELADFYRKFDRVLSLPEHPEIMDAKHEQPQGYLHGYRIAIRDAKRAARTERATTTDGESSGRPTRPDGTPYRYHEIKAGGWGHCDGCRTWGQWTAEKPHECPGTFNHGPVVPTPGG